MFDTEAIQQVLDSGGELLTHKWWATPSSIVRGGVIHLDDLEPTVLGSDVPPTSLYILPPYLSTGDYSGAGSLGIANRQIIVDLCEDLPHVYDVVAAYGYASIALGGEFFNPSAMGGLPNYSQVLSALRRLADYPVLCEDTLAQVESDLEQDAWDAWAKLEFRTALERRWGIVNLTDSQLESTFYNAMESSNCYWVHQHDGPYVDTERLAAAITLL